MSGAEALVERLSIELTNQCSKRCDFCYNASHPLGATRWTPAALVGFVQDCAAQGTRAVSFGGGEPLEFPGWDRVLTDLDGIVFRSLTTNGLHLARELERLVAARPDKVHVSLHFPDRSAEVERVVRQVGALAERGIRSGVNLLVARSRLDAARRASDALRAADIGTDRIVYLPMRIRDTPTSQEVAQVARTPRFQSMSCLAQCGKSPRFASVSWDQRVGWCSYTRAKRALESATAAGLRAALEGLPLVFCGPVEAGD